MIAVVDVCGGNLRSVAKALEAVGGAVTVTRDPREVARADKVVVPGQGAFAPFMRGLEDHGLEAPIRDGIARGRPYLGICLGLQVLFDESEEHGPVRGLGVVPGRVVRFSPRDPALKIPHMGWNRAEVVRPDALLPTAGTHYYFVHSFYAAPRDPAHVVMTAEHGESFCAAIRVGNLFACQFHPEKSQAAGLALLGAFVRS